MRSSHLVSVLVALILAPEVCATDVTLLLVDQLGSPIPASQFKVEEPDGAVVPQGGTVDLAPGVHLIRSFPGLLGHIHGSELSRDDSIVVGTSPMVVTFVWPLSALIVSLEDQNGASIPDSQVNFWLDTVPNGTPLLLPVTDDPSFTIGGTYAAGYPIHGFPGLNGQMQGSELYREYPPVELVQSGVIYQLTWSMAPLTVTVVDQNLIPIPASQLSLPGGAVPSGTTVVLPVTDDPLPPVIQGGLSSGYDLREFPGILGAVQGSIVYRDYPDNELSASGSFLALEHPEVALRLDLVDQDGLLIPASQFSLDVPNGNVLNGVTRVLPVTEVTSGPPVLGSSETGYALRAFPGINGLLHGSLLHRDDPPVELLEAGLVRSVVWPVAKGPLHVVLGNGMDSPGASVRGPYLGTLPLGTPVVLPITEDPLHPILAGDFAVGYDITFLLQSLRKSRPSPRRTLEYGPHLFELMPGGTTSPAFVTIHGEQVGLRIGP